MDDLDRLLAETMRDAAEQAPSDDDLLATVHRRSDRRRRQRISTVLSAVAAVLAVGIPTLVARTSATGPPVSAVPVTPSPATGAVRLAGGFTPPTFPYTLPATGGMKAPVTSMDGGNLVAFFEATELRDHADVTVTVSSRKPAFSGPATETSVRVRGHSGTLRTVEEHPARQLILYWPESSARWIRLATDDTYTPQQVLALADALVPASIAVLPPFRLDLSPAGFVSDTVSESTMSFRSPVAAGRIDVVLRKRRQLSQFNQMVGSYQAVLTHGAGGVTLDVDVTDWNATLEVTVGRELTMSDADLLRFAAGVHILNRSNPA